MIRFNNKSKLKSIENRNFDKISDIVIVYIAVTNMFEKIRKIF